MEKMIHISIDELAKIKKELLLEKQQNKDSTIKKNLKLQTKIKKYKNKASKNDAECIKKNGEIDRELKRICKLIELEREHANIIADQEKAKAKKR